MLRLSPYGASLSFHHFSSCFFPPNPIHECHPQRQFYPTEKHNITDERQALQDTLQVLEDHLRGDGGEGNSDRLFLSSSSSSRPGLGDLAVYGTLRALEGLPLHAAILAGTTTAKTTTTTGDETPPVAVLGSWYERMQRLTPSAAIIRH